MLLKNVQDGISRPLGNRAIQKTKVETDLLDTLYLIRGLLYRLLLWCAAAPTCGFTSVYVSGPVTGQEGDILSGSLKVTLCSHFQRTHTDVPI